MSGLRFSGSALASVLLLTALTGCGSLDRARGQVGETLKPYRVSVVQGNVVTREQLALLRPGVSRIQVRDLLGTPLLTSVFHEDRWDYVFTLRRQGVEPQSRRVTIFFDGDLISRIEADPLPTEAEFAALLDAGSKPAKVPVLEAPAESLKQAPAARPAEPVVLPPLPASYPPLEPTGR